MIEVTGRVVFNAMEGGFWGIVGDDGRQYDPLSLPAPFQVEGMGVRCRLERAEVMSLRMWGIPVRILDLEPVTE